MAIVRNTADGGTNGSGGLGSLTLANSTNSGIALTPVGVAPSYSSTVTRRGLSLEFVTPTGTSYVTTPITGSPTAMTVLFYDYIPTAVGSTSEVHSLRNGATRVVAINQTNTNKIQFFGVSTTALWTSTAAIPVTSWYRVAYAYDAAGNWFIKVYQGDTTTIVDQGSGTGADFSSVGAPTIMSFGKRSGNYAGTRYMDDLSYESNSSTEIPATNPPAPTAGPYGRVAIIGDSTISQDGNGATNVPAAFVTAGWLAGDVWFYGVGSKDLSSADANGYTAIQNIQQARAALGAEPAVWVFSLSINNMGQTDATNTTRIGAIMSEINSIGSPGRVLWVGGTQTPSLDANRLRFNVLMRTLMATYPTLYHTDLDSWMHNGRDETGLWASPADANFAHMSTAGYAIKNAFMASQARKLASHAEVNYTTVQVGTSPARALYVGGIIGWVKS